MPVAASRHSSTPCHSGVTQASGCIHTGSWSIGKKVPENSISGVTTNRNRMLKPLSFSSRAARAKVGTANASPVSTAAGTASTTHHEEKAPNGAATRTKIAAPVNRWKATTARWPPSTSTTRSGVASIAAYIWFHLM